MTYSRLITLTATVVIVGVGAALLRGPSAETSAENTAEPAAAPPVDGSDALVDITLPANLSANAVIGQTVFTNACAACHGDNGVGRDGLAPPLIHRIYEPSHHGDEAFQIAAARGVRAHHWQFGNMPPVEGLTRGDVTMVVAYIRELQSANGID